MTSTQAGSRRDRAIGSCASSSARRIAGRARSISPLRQAEQRHSGLGVSSSQAGLAVRLLRLRELAAQPLDLGQLVVGRSEHIPCRWAGEPLARSTGGFEGVRPRALQLEDLAAMDETVASERNEVGLRVAPARERLRPLPRATEIEHRLTQGDHLAVGDPGEHRRNLVCRDRDHDLVQQRHALGDSSLQDQRVPAAEPREHRRVGDPRSARRSPPPRRSSRMHVCVSLEQARQRGEHPQPGLLDAVAAAVLQDPAAAGDPAHRRSQVAPEEEPERLPERAACGALRFAAAQPRVVGGDPGLFASVVSPDHVRGNRKALEILDVQLPLTMSRRQLGERITPHPTLERAAGSLFSIGHGHRLTICPGVGDITAIRSPDVGVRRSTGRCLDRVAGEQSAGSR